MNGFDHVISGELVATEFDYSSHDGYLSIEDGRRGGKSLCITYNMNRYRMEFEQVDQTLIFGVAIKFIDNTSQSLGTTSRSFTLGIGNNYSGWVYPTIILRTSTSGSVSLERNHSSTGYYTLIAESPPGVLKADTWHYFELKVRVHDTSGEAIVKVDGRTVIDFSGDTYYSGDVVTCQVQLGGRLTTAYTYFDDLYVLTDSGEAPTDFLGDCMVDTIRPSAAGTHTEMTPSAGSNYECVNEIVLDDTDYVSFSGEEGIKDCYDFDGVSGETTIHGIRLLRAGLLESGSLYSKPLLNVYGNLYSGEEEVIGGTLEYDSQTYPTDPESGEVWTNDKINKYEFGMITS